MRQLSRLFSVILLAGASFGSWILFGGVWAGESKGYKQRAAMEIVAKQFAPMDHRVEEVKTGDADKDKVQTSSQKQTGSPTVLFSVMGELEGAYGYPDEEIEYNIEPIVIIKGGRYASPPGGYNDKPTKQFVAKYYRPGQKYRVLFGGGEVGTVVIKKQEFDFQDSGGCTHIEALVTLDTRINIGGPVGGLATNSDKLGQQKSFRRAPTKAERVAVLKLARTIYKRKGVPSSLLKLMKTTNLTANDLEGYGKFELIGSFTIQREEGDHYIMHSLFLIAEPDGEGFKEGFSWYHQSIYDADIETQDFIDQLDLDDDDMAEVITIFQSYEAHHYVIYKKHKRQWRKVYESYGWGC